ncbi:hypothetical protein PMAYCL1PPCAC_22364, partial [Pristionchus mayeri]
LLLSSCLLLVISQTKVLERDDRDGESCGADSVPYLIEIDEDGKPELYCDVPVCFESHHGRSKNTRKERTHDEPVCNGELLETVCEGEREWTSGLKEYDNGTHRILNTECCSYDGLIGAQALKVAI